MTLFESEWEDGLVFSLAFPRRTKRFIFGVLETWMMLKQEARRALAFV